MRANVLISLSIALLAAGCVEPGTDRAAPSFSKTLPSTAVQRNDLEREGAGRLGKSNPTLYVGNELGSQSNVLVFANAGKTLDRTLNASSTQFGLATDTAGNLFVASGDGNYQNEHLDVYRDQGSTLVETLQQKHPFKEPVVDTSGHLYVTCALYRVCEYGPSKKNIIGQRIIRRISLRGFGVAPDSLTTDSSGDLAVSDVQTVRVFAPGATSPYWSISTDQTQGGVAFDPAGELFVAKGDPRSGNSTISVYNPGKSSPTRAFVDPNGAYATILRFDRAGDLFAFTPTCATCPPPAVTVFGPGKSSPERAVTQGIEQFTGSVQMVVDPMGGIYVSNRAESSKGSVAVYRPKQVRPLRVITNGISNPSYLAVSL